MSKVSDLVETWQDWKVCVDVFCVDCEAQAKAMSLAKNVGKAILAQTKSNPSLATVLDENAQAEFQTLCAFLERNGLPC